MFPLSLSIIDKKSSSNFFVDFEKNFDYFGCLIPVYTT